MPRVTALKAEIGTTGNVRTFPISADAASDIAEAVIDEHRCDNNHCDIDQALGEGFPYVAAYLLAGATETPLLDAVCSFHSFNNHATYDDIPNWDDWVAWHGANTKQCLSCDAYCAADASSCDNCLGESFSTD